MNVGQRNVKGEQQRRQAEVAPMGAPLQRRIFAAARPSRTPAASAAGLVRSRTASLFRRFHRSVPAMGPCRSCRYRVRPNALPSRVERRSGTTSQPPCGLVDGRSGHGGHDRASGVPNLEQSAPLVFPGRLPMLPEPDGTGLTPARCGLFLSCPSSPCRERLGEGRVRVRKRCNINGLRCPGGPLAQPLPKRAEEHDEFGTRPAPDRGADGGEEHGQESFILKTAVGSRLVG